MLPRNDNSVGLKLCMIGRALLSTSALASLFGAFRPGRGNPVRAKGENLDRRRYAQFVEKCRRRRVSTIIPNSSVSRATIVIRNLLIMAAEEHSPIRLLSGELTRDVYEPLVPDLEAALEAKCDIRIVTHRNTNELRGNRFYETIRARDPHAIRSLNIPLDTHSHFMLVGTTAYRMEVDDTTREATACFNDTTEILIPALQLKFEEAWSGATEPISQ